MPTTLIWRYCFTSISTSFRLDILCFDRACGKTTQPPRLCARQVPEALHFGSRVQSFSALRTRLHQLSSNLTSDNSGGFLDGAQGHGAVLRIKKSVKRRAAGMHPARHFDLAQALRVHRSLNLSGDGPFDCGRADVLIETFLTKPAIEGRADILLNVPVPFFRLIARSISCLGVFCFSS